MACETAACSVPQKAFLRSSPGSWQKQVGEAPGWLYGEHT